MSRLLIFYTDIFIDAYYNLGDDKIFGLDEDLRLAYILTSNGEVKRNGKWESKTIERNR